MQRFIHNENIALYEKLIAESELDQSRDEQRHKMLLTLLAEEKANIQKPLDSWLLAAPGRPHLTFGFSADSLPLFGTMSNVTLSPSRKSLKPALSTAEM